ncbi:Inner membrane protein YibH [Posidoniimonas polymericola]|uniref:Inner membrane protein YibH n=1 Tax=Posidoniimonas polymericola TaxID=2528002 RepID=A0A5C5YLV5_9BACT|nr:efflux RND transporter periplasmic adaptor subunit [Posidoniimonas polymericola]TWT75943.1 Inner membrane protein YibH [Posidoniimonas polymericola]
MIIFLTLLYIGLLFALKAAGIIRLNLAWKLSPIAWFLLLNVTLFVPLQWGAPAGPVGVFRNVIEIVPAVSGQVTEVPVTPLTEVEEGDPLFQIDPEPFRDDVRRLTAALDEARQQPKLLQASVEIAEAAVARSEAERDQASAKLGRSKRLVGSGAVTQEEYEADLRSAVVADRAVKEAAARLNQAQVQFDSVTAEGENTAVAQATQALARAQYDLDHATVRAPTKGVVQQLALSPGTRVAAMPMRGSLLFVETDRTRIAVAIQQNQLRYVRADQPAEVVLKFRPGRTFAAKVVGVAAVTSGGQVRTSGVVEDITAKQQRAEPYQVVLELTDPSVDANTLPGGAVGVAAIYTDHVTFAHVIRKVMLRMTAWTNYLW